MKLLVAIVGLIALCVANIASAQVIVLHKCSLAGKASLVESGSSSQESSKIHSVQARIAAAVKATDAIAASDPIFAKLKAAPGPFTIKTIIPRNGFPKNGLPWTDKQLPYAANLKKIWPSCKAGVQPIAEWEKSWTQAKDTFLLRERSLDQYYFLKSANDVYPIAKAACDVAVSVGSQVGAATGAYIQPNGDCHVGLEMDSKFGYYHTRVPIEEFQRYIKG